MEIAQVGEPVLHSPARQVRADEFAQSALQNFTAELLACMLAAKGIGIAAPQVFDSRALMYIASRANARYPDAPNMEPMLLINPRITAQSSHTVKHWEGCLSVPGLRGLIERPDWLEANYQNIHGEHLHIRFEGFLARIFLHEYDHLIGKTWLDHVASSADIMAESVWIKQFAQEPQG